VPSESPRIDALAVAGSEQPLKNPRHHNGWVLGICASGSVYGAVLKRFCVLTNNAFAAAIALDGVAAGKFRPVFVALQNVFELARAQSHMRLPQIQHLLLDLLRICVMRWRRGCC